MAEERFTDEDARTAWDFAADAWQTFVRDGDDYFRRLLHGPALLDATRVQPGERVLDLGCGEGYFARELARRGAHVTGVDLSPKLVACARQEEQRAPLGIEYRVLSASRVDGEFDPASFDLVTACLALQDMADGEGCLRAAHRVLRRGGRMAFSVPHPYTDAPVHGWERDALGHKQRFFADRYFDTGPAVCEWNMPRLRYRWSSPYWRRTLEEWTAASADAGFLIRRIHEPKPAAQVVREQPALAHCTRLPYFLVFELLSHDAN